MGWRGSSGSKSIDARALDVGQVLAAERDQLALEVGAGVVHVHRLHDGLDLFAEVVVGDAEHGDVHHLRVGDEQVLGFLRIDVHAAADDHERLAVGQEQEAVVVEVADVAERRPVGDGRDGATLVVFSGSLWYSKFDAPSK